MNDEKEGGDKSGEVQFLCDAMLGGLARWLRAAGYGAEFDVHAADGALVRRAVREGKVLLTSDAGILERYAVSEGLARCVFVPRGLSVLEQLAHVLRVLRLRLRGESRCMDCNGSLEPVRLESVADRVPAKVKRTCRAFFRCRSCRKVYWHGTHWEDIRRRLEGAERLAGREQRGA